MPHIDSTNFGSITIEGKKYFQVLIIEDKVEEREYERLESLFGTSHRIGEWETEKLLDNKPDIIVIGNGQSGMLEVSEDLKNKASDAVIELITAITPEAIEIYNTKMKEGQQVNALIHTTC